MAVAAAVFFNQFREDLANGAIDLTNDTITAALFTSSLTPNAATQEDLADLTNEVSGGSYARINLASQSVAESGGTVTFDADDLDFGTVTIADFKYLILFDNTTASDRLICYIDLENGGGSLARSSESLTITWNASGIFTIT